MEEDFPGIAFSLFQSGGHKGNPPGKEKDSLSNMKTRTPPINNSMKHSSRDCRPIAGLLIPLLLVCLAYIQQAQATDLDSALPNGNTADGSGVLLSLTSGVWNSGFGFEALNHNTAGKDNTATGLRALFSDTGGSYNSATGVYALYSNINGWYNNAVGAYALANNISGNYNTANGYAALYRNTADYNTANGYAALYHNTIGIFNTANGVVALQSNTAGFLNTATGSQALQSNTTGVENTATGSRALSSNTTGVQNTATGAQALFFNTTGADNTANGFRALFNNTDGTGNTAYGYQALLSNTGSSITGAFNTAIGLNALLNNVTGTGNIALGGAAGDQITTGDENIDIGNNGQFSDDRTIRIGQDQTRTFIAAIRGVATGTADAIPVLIDSFGQLGTTSSSRRFKKEIKPMDQTSEAILALKPVTFHYKSDASGTPQFGLIAEEVAQVNPDLVVRDEKGDIYTVRYDAVNAMLLNEFLKVHRKVEELEAFVDRQQKSFQSKLAEQDKQIEALASVVERVGAQLEMSKPAPQVVVSKP